MPHKWIMFTLFCELCVFTLLVAVAWGTTGVFLGVPIALVSGWQMGCMSERNDWDKWSRRKLSGTSRESDSPADTAGA